MSFAILDDQFDALKLLVERGANLGVVDSDGHSLLSIVARYGKMSDLQFYCLTPVRRSMVCRMAT
jgi:ankyrin repeat protein